METKKCCFIGHRKIETTLVDKKCIYNFIENLIVNENVKVFLFGSKSQFNDLCYKIVSKLKEKHQNIERVYVRSIYENINDMYMQYLIKGYEKTVYAKRCTNAGKISYLLRNQQMIDYSDYCIFYYNENYLPPKRKWARRDLFEYQPKSGTALAYHYAEQKKKNIKNFFKK